MKRVSPYIMPLTWKEARVILLEHNPNLVKAIDDLDPSDEYLLFRVKYPYSQAITREGRYFCLPDEKGFSRKLSELANDYPLLRKAFQYIVNIPLGVMIKNTSEVYLETNGRVSTYCLFGPGSIVGRWSLLDSDYACDRGSMWNMSSGARTIASLPKISNLVHHNKLEKEFRFRSGPPDGLLDHWRVLTALYQAPYFPSKWYSEFLFFSGKWLENKTDPAWRLFRHYLIEDAWHHSGFMRNQQMHEYIWTSIIEEATGKLNPYLVDTVKHLFSIGSGSNPGFSIAINDSVGPISEFQKIYEEVYQLKEYAPSFISPKHFNLNDPGSGVYYSLQLPTLINFFPHAVKNSSKKDDIRSIVEIIKYMVGELAKDAYGLGDQTKSIHTLAQQLDFRCYHETADYMSSIYGAQDLLEKDSGLRKDGYRFPDKQVCHHSPFFKGCIRITKKGAR